MTIFLVTGTDTGIGKTAFTTLFLKKLISQNIDVRGVKAIETGCIDNIGLDATAIHKAANGNAPSKALYQYEPPVAPVVAARTPIDPKELIDKIKAEAQKSKHLIIE